MQLKDALDHCGTCEGFRKIFEGRVKTEIDLFWGSDSVSIDGYEGSVSTLFIARQILQKFHSVKEEEAKDALALSELIKDKVFIPLRNRMLEADQDTCNLATIAYQIRNCAQNCWTPADPKFTAGYHVLNHSMCLMLLDKSL
jgi:hypothetical protein